MKKLFVLMLLFLMMVGYVVWQYGGALSLDMPDLLSKISDAEPSEPEPISETQAAPQAVSESDEIRAIWVATAYAIDYPMQSTTDADSLKSRCDAILDNAKANGFNTVYFQVRPAADALYASDLFPWSRYLTGTCGTAPDGDFDPLSYWVEQAHARGMKLEAWVNPYRICAGENAAGDYAALPDSSPAKQHPEWVVSCDGGYYFNPGIKEVRDLICSGITEIVKSYDVDGIQFDDYFYPAETFDDADTYAAYDGDLSRDDWRRDNVNQLVQAVGQAVHQNARNLSCVFGISPSGIWRNKGVNSFGGSDTNGYEHYTSAYADSLTWIKNGWIDYICPQIYWEIGYTPADFEVLATWWANQVRGTHVQLILGLAAYKIDDATYGDVWKNDGCAEIGRQIDLIHHVDGIGGCAVFSYRNLENIDGLAEQLRSKWNT